MILYVCLECGRFVLSFGIVEAFATVLQRDDKPVVVQPCLDCQIPMYRVKEEFDRLQVIEAPTLENHGITVEVHQYE